MQLATSHKLYPIDGFLFLLGHYNLPFGAFLLAIIFLIEIAFLSKQKSLKIFGMLADELNGGNRTL